MGKVTYQKLHVLQTRVLRQGVRLISALEDSPQFEEELTKFEEITDKLNDTVKGVTLADVEATHEEKVTLLRQAKLLQAIYNFFE